jgi:oxygen-independent coproporphyrinogen-3 oxidase
MQTTVSKVEHLYVHVPFCVAKCDYCAFYSRPGSAEQMNEYVNAVLVELERFAPQLATKTIFIGGGTPSVLPTPLMRQFFDGLRRYLPLKGISEWTVECNPATVDREKARMMHDAGVNRISLGVQSLDDALLKAIGRVHSAKQAVATYELLRKSGFENINLDLMFGLPGQTVAQFAATLQRSIALQPEHVSTYCLTLEEDTEFWRLYTVDPVGARHAVPLPDDNEQLAMYETAIETLEAAGYRQYEISNFAKPGRECAHNIAYWKVEDYIGLGPSACSTVGTRRWQNVADTDRYIAAMRTCVTEAATGSRRREVGRDGSSRRAVICFEETVTPELRAAERAAFGMRMNAGVPAELVNGRWDKEIAGLLSAELVQWRNGRLTPTRRGILFADEVAAEFL